MAVRARPDELADGNDGPARTWAAAAMLVAATLAGCGGAAPPHAHASPHAAASFAAAPAAPAAQHAGAAIVWAVGDGAAAQSGAPAVVARIARHRADRLLYLGDVYESGTASEFARAYAPTFGRFAKITSPTPGNHEWARRAQGYDAYWRSVRGAAPPPYYALRVGGWQILSLNSETAHGAGSPQLRWLERRLRAPGDCRIAMWHRPRFSAGVVHGDQPDVEPFWSALRGRARIVLAGHEHDMQRFLPRNGITEFVSGAGGNGHYALRPRPGLAFGDATHYGALRLALRPRRAQWAFVSAGGATLDSGTIRCAAHPRR
jgi:hypothetical protein